MDTAEIQKTNKQTNKKKNQNTMNNYMPTNLTIWKKWTTF